MSKHQELLDYLANLAAGSKISVRGLANRLKVSDGTAYRAIKEAESRGWVETHPRSGTVRIDRQAGRPEKLRFAQLAQISESVVVAGQAGLDKEFSQFAIGAMTKENIGSYLVSDGLVIVGDREDIQELALANGNALLVTGGFAVIDQIKAMADQKALPIMVSPHDTFSVASLIHQAFATVANQSLSRSVADIYQDKDSYGFLTEEASVADYMVLYKTTNRVRFPVVTRTNQLMGVISLRDIMGYPSHFPLARLMTEHPVTTSKETSLAKVNQIMIREDFDMLPVVDDEGLVLGVVTRRQVMETLQDLAGQVFCRQPATYLTNLVQKGRSFSLPVADVLSRHSGQLDPAGLAELLTQIQEKILGCEKKHIIIEQMMIYWLEEFEPVGLLTIEVGQVSVHDKTLLEFNLFLAKKQVAKALLTSIVN